MGVQIVAAFVHVVALAVAHHGIFMWCHVWSRCLHLLQALKDDLLLRSRSLFYPWSPSQTLVARGFTLLILAWHHSLQSNTLLLHGLCKLSLWCQPNMLWICQMQIQLLITHFQWWYNLSEHQQRFFWYSKWSEKSCSSSALALLSQSGHWYHTSTQKVNSNLVL